MVTTSDTLHRHELSHHTAGKGGNDRTHRITVKTFRACFSCATARVRCSGGVPCGRCETRSLECQYPTKRRSKAKFRNETVQRSPSAEMYMQESQSIQASSPQLRADHAVLNQTISFAVSGVSESQPSPKRRPLSMAAHPPSERKVSFTRGSDIRTYGSSGTGTMTASTSTDHPQPYNTMSNLNLDMASSGVERDTETALDFGHGNLDHTMISTLNWLPDAILTVTSHGEAQHGFESGWAQSAVSRNHATRMPWQHPSILNDQLSPGYLSLESDLRSARPYSLVSGETSSPGRQVSSEKRPADCSVNQRGTHFSNDLGSQVSWSTPETNTGSGQPTDGRYVHHFAFPSLDELQIGESTPDHFVHYIRPIETSTHDQIYRNFLDLCRQDNPFFSKFESENFPSVENCNRYLLCYFRSCQTVYPLIHMPLFNPNRCHWTLTLAILAIGCHYSKTRQADQCTAAFREFIRRAIFCEVG